MVTRPAEDLLRRLATGDEGSLRSVLTPTLDGAGVLGGEGESLTPRTRMLVRLAALLAVGASTTSLRWAVELASCAGAEDEEIVDVLVTVGSAVGLAGVAANAPRLALAIGYDIEVEGWDGS